MLAHTKEASTNTTRRWSNNKRNWSWAYWVWVHRRINNDWLIDCRMFQPCRFLSTASYHQHRNEPHSALIQVMQWTLTTLVHTWQRQLTGTHLHGSRRETLLPWATTSCDLSVLMSKLVIGSVSLLLLITSFVRVSHILQTWGGRERCQLCPGTPPCVNMQYLHCIHLNCKVCAYTYS